MKFTAHALVNDGCVMSGWPNRITNTRPITTYNGVPGWCGTPTMWLTATNSPQSQ